MHRIAYVTALLIAIWFLAGYAKTADQLKNELKDFLPSGQKARLAWCVCDELYGPDLPSTIYVMDSQDGIARELTPNSVFGSGSGVRHLVSPSITDDGSRVVFFDDIAYIGYVINWDGSGLRQITTEGYMSRYWRDPDTDSEYVTVEVYDIRKVNIDKPEETEVIWNESGFSRPWYTLSKDGTRMGFNCPHPNSGIATIPNGSLDIYDNASCFPNISPDNTYRLMVQNGNHTQHPIYLPNGSIEQTLETSGPIISWATEKNWYCGGEHEYECTRWVEPDYITFYMYQVKAGGFIKRISDGQWMYIVDTEQSPTGGCTTLAGNMDMRLFPWDDNYPTPVASLRATPVPARKRPAPSAIYAINGRIIGAAAKNSVSPGIVIQRIKDGNSARLQAAFVR